MGLFSKELRELDRNTVQYMIDEMQDEIDASKKIIEEQGQQLATQEQQIAKQGQQLAEKDCRLLEQSNLLNQQMLENQLYGLLSRDGHLEKLGRAVTDIEYRKQLLAEYKLNL